MGETPELRPYFLACLLLMSPSVALADEANADSGEPKFVMVSGSFALVSDYRFRGVSLSDKDITVQGGLTLTSASGLYIGTWASSIETFNGAETEVDLVGGYSFEAATLEIDMGITAYLFPGGEDANYVEPYLSLGRSFGPVSLTSGIAYAPKQDNIGRADSVYLYQDASLGLGDSPFTVAGHVGLEDGAFGDEKVDWRLGLETTLYGVDLSVAYVDTNKAGRSTDATAVVSIGLGF